MRGQKQSLWEQAQYICVTRALHELYIYEVKENHSPREERGSNEDHTAYSRKIKEKYLKEAISEYSKRLSRYCRLEIIEVSDEKTPEQASQTVEEQIREKEGERLLKQIRTTCM